MNRGFGWEAVCNYQIWRPQQTSGGFSFLSFWMSDNFRDGGKKLICQVQEKCLVNGSCLEKENN